MGGKIGLSGGEALEAKLREISEKVGEKATLRVGFLEGSTEPNGIPSAYDAAIQEWGAPSRGIPPRPFFRPMIAEKNSQWGPALGNLLKTSDFRASTALNSLGQGIEGQLRNSIINVHSPALSPVTLLLRQRFGNNPQEIRFSDVMRAREDIAKGVKPDVSSTQSKPLIWTGSMLNAVSHEVETE